jgi:hypothetical protein
MQVDKTKSLNDPKLIVRQSRWQMLLFAVLTLPFVFGGYLMWSVAVADNADQTELLKAIGVGVFFLACFLVFVFKAVKAGPVLEVRADGIVLEPSSAKPFFVPFGQIEEFQKLSVRGSEMLTIKVNNVDAIHEAADREKYLLSGVNSAMGFGDFSVPLVGTGMSAADLIEAIREQAKLAAVDIADQQVDSGDLRI